MKDRTYLPQENLDLDSKILLSVIAQLDMGNHWKMVFIDSIDILKNKGDYITIAEIFESINELRPGCIEEDLYRTAEEIGFRMRSYGPSEIDEDNRNPIELKLYNFSKEGYQKLGNEKKVKEVSEKIRELEEEIVMAEKAEEEEMSEGV